MRLACTQCRLTQALENAYFSNDLTNLLLGAFREPGDISDVSKARCRFLLCHSTALQHMLCVSARQQGSAWLNCCKVPKQS